METIPKKRVLICPLGWGLGHASRIIPIISRFEKEGYEVITSGDDPQMKFIASFFPNIRTIVFPSFRVKLAKGTNQLLPLAWLVIRLPYFTFKEHIQVKKIIRKYNIDIIISDNRYGLWSTKAKTVFVTHQLRVIFPKPFQFLESIGEKYIRFCTNRFDYCWIPDFSDDNNLSGELSHSTKLSSNIRFIGSLSRFHEIKLETEDKSWDLVGISSGPSPQREIFIDLIERIAICHKLKTLIIKGNPNEGTIIAELNGISYVGHLGDTEFAEVVKSSKYLITRSGYSTIMDLVAIGVSGLIVPTPGQTEQEYLACYLSKKGLFKTCKQGDLEKIDISISCKSISQFNNSTELFEKSFQELISTIS